MFGNMSRSVVSEYFRDLYELQKDINILVLATELLMIWKVFYIINPS
jgi:hypothetical protein